MATTQILHTETCVCMHCSLPGWNSPTVTDDAPGLGLEVIRGVLAGTVADVMAEHVQVHTVKRELHTYN